MTCSLAIKAGKASVVTDTIESFTEKGIKLDSGAELEADIIVTATGLTLQMFGGAELVVDGARIDPGKLIVYRGAMFAGVPNFFSVFGYTNASWTLKADLISEYACRLINYMGQIRPGASTCRARPGRAWRCARSWISPPAISSASRIAAQANRHRAMEAQPKLRPRHRRAALWAGRGRRAGVSCAAGRRGDDARIGNGGLAQSV